MFRAALWLKMWSAQRLRGSCISTSQDGFSTLLTKIRNLPRSRKARPVIDTGRAAAFSRILQNRDFEPGENEDALSAPVPKRVSELSDGTLPPSLALSSAPAVPL